MSLILSSLSSFDIFDTLLTRLVIEPTEIFRICGDRAVRFGWIDLTAETWRRLRINAEQRSRQFYEGGEVTLTEIYRELANALEIPLEIIAKLQQLELTVEAEYLVPVPEAKAMVAKARESHPKASNILFLSDMYLPKDFLEQILKQHGFWQDSDRIYVSCDSRKSKGKGDLFLQVLEDLQINPTALTHTGNSKHSDVQQPRSLGINSIYFDDANPNRYESILQKYAQVTNGLTPLWAGIARQSRLAQPAETPKAQVLRDVATSVAAPILTAYTIWILQQAKAKQLARIYFLARDGEILLQIAQRLAPSIYPEVDLRYLYVSRQALRMPGMTEVNQAFWEWMFDDTDIFTIDSLLARMCLDHGVAEPIFATLGYPRSTWSKNLSPSERSALRRNLEQNQSLPPLILEMATQKRQVLKSYLEQEKMLDGSTFGLVDVGWRGSLQLSLESAFATFGDRNLPMPVGFYFALDRPSGGLKLKGEVLAFFFNLNNGTGLRHQIDYRYVSAMEVFCAGCEGTTLTYAYDDLGKVIPVLKHQRNQPACDWGLPAFQQSVLTFVDRFVDYFIDHPSSTDYNLLTSPKLLREALDELFIAFSSSPTRQEAEAFTDCPFFDDPNELYHFYWVMPFCAKDVLNYAIARRESFNIHRNSWNEASLKVSSSLVKFLLPKAILQRKVLQLIKRRVKQALKRN